MANYQENILEKDIKAGDTIWNSCSWNKKLKFVIFNIIVNLSFVWSMFPTFIVSAEECKA